MDVSLQAVDIQVVSTATPMFGYDLDVQDGLALAHDINNEIYDMTTAWPERFIGLGTLPMQDVPTAIGELERCMTDLGFKGAELDTVVNGKNWDEPEFLPLFQAAEDMGAVLFYHPQPNNNLVAETFAKYSMGNSFGVPLEVSWKNVRTLRYVLHMVEAPHVLVWAEWIAAGRLEQRPGPIYRDPQVLIRASCIMTVSP